MPDNADFWHFTLGNLITIAIFLAGGSGPLAVIIRMIKNDRQRFIDRLEAHEKAISDIRTSLAEIKAVLASRQLDYPGPLTKSYPQPPTNMWKKLWKTILTLALHSGKLKL